jgi:hypothetical protein
MTSSNLKTSIMTNAVAMKDLKFALTGITDCGMEKHVATRMTGLVI